MSPLFYTRSRQLSLDTFRLTTQATREWRAQLDSCLIPLDIELEDLTRKANEAATSS